ncbi:unnamed protein product [Tetraodon nigroviridis]|uniref:Chromosome 9 SCAF15033, whole genome shotgun sequence n=1 Tax=Tetraodon nigroviridis TaxID=99883 RepID=Q4RK32_TETNG|nr:unnamed protein product [Tetraodon nigroviridis]
MFDTSAPVPLQTLRAVFGPTCRYCLYLWQNNIVFNLNNKYASVEGAVVELVPSSHTSSRPLFTRFASRTATTPRMETSTPFEGGAEIGAGLGLYEYHWQAYAEKTSPARVGTVSEVCAHVQSELLCAFTHTPYASEKQAGRWEGRSRRHMRGGG